MTCHLNWRTQSALAAQVIIPTKCTHIAAGGGGTNVTLATKCAHVAAEGGGGGLRYKGLAQISISL